MRKVLDLSAFAEETMELRIDAETVLQLQKPTQYIVIEMLKFRNIDENTEPEVIIKAIDNLCLLIINSNDKMKVYTMEQVNKMLNMSQKLKILQVYSEFISDIQNDPN